MPQILLEPLLEERPDPVFLNLLKQRRKEAISQATPNFNMCVTCLLAAFEAFQVYRVPDWCMFIGPDDYKYFDLDLTETARLCCKCLEDPSECFQLPESLVPMTKSVMSRFLINGVLLESKSRMPKELAEDKEWANEVGELQKWLIPLFEMGMYQTPFDVPRHTGQEVFIGTTEKNQHYKGMPSAQLALLLAISEGVQTVLANQDSDEAMAKSKSIDEALAKITGGN